MEPKRSNVAGAAARTDSFANGQLPSLTSFRGVAALWVVIYHYSTQTFTNLDVGAHTQIFDKGYLAVDMFFMLSGFVLTHVYLRQFLTDVSANYRSFVAARIARIYPLHLLILLLLVVAALAAKWNASAPFRWLESMPLHGPYSVLAFIANIFLVQGADAGKLSWNYPTWSISVEFMAYLLFPFVLPVLWRANRATKTIVAVALAGCLAAFAVVANDNFDQWDGPIVLLRCFPEFLLGALLYCVFRTAGKGTVLDRDWAAFGVLLIAIVWLHFGAPDLVVAMLFALLILTAVCNTGRFTAWANAPLLVWLGNISYSIYLIHGFVQFLATKVLARLGTQDAGTLPIWQSAILMASMLALCLVASHLSYFGFEIGSRRYVRNLLGSASWPAAKLWLWGRVGPQDGFELRLAPVRRRDPGAGSGEGRREGVRN